MSGVRQKDRSKNRFTTLDKILDVYDHTTTVTANPNVFDRTYSGLINRINSEAAMIYHYCRVANEDLDNRIQSEAKQRLELQEKAIDRCLWLKTDIRLAQRTFHLRARRVVYWNNLVNVALDAIKSWNSAEKRAYKDKYGL
jgi:hypothetical protein